MAEAPEDKQEIYNSLKRNVAFVDSVQKIADVVAHSNFEAIKLFPSAIGLEKVSYEKFKMNDFEVVGYDPGETIRAPMAV